MLSAVSAFFEHVKPPHIFDCARPSSLRCCQILGRSARRPAAIRGARRPEINGLRDSDSREGLLRGTIAIAWDLFPRVRTNFQSLSKSRARRHATADDSRLPESAMAAVDALDRLRVSRAKHEHRRDARSRATSCTFLRMYCIYFQG